MSYTDADGLENPQQVKKLREIMQEKLEDYCFERRGELKELRGRHPKLLTTLRPLQSTAQAIVHRIRIDQLTKEKKLNETAELLFFGSTRKYEITKCRVKVAGNKNDAAFVLIVNK